MTKIKNLNNQWSEIGNFRNGILENPNINKGVEYGYFSTIPTTEKGHTLLSLEKEKVGSTEGLLYAKMSGESAEGSLIYTELI